MKNVILSVLFIFGYTSYSKAELCNINIAKKPAIAAYSLLTGGQKIRFRQKVSDEYTLDSYRRQLQNTSPVSRYYNGLLRAIQELEQNPNLHYYNIALEAGEGDERSQDFYTVVLESVGPNCVVKQVEIDN